MRAARAGGQRQLADLAEPDPGVDAPFRLALRLQVRRRPGGQAGLRQSCDSGDWRGAEAAGWGRERPSANGERERRARASYRDRAGGTVSGDPGDMDDVTARRFAQGALLGGEPEGDPGDAGGGAGGDPGAGYGAGPAPTVGWAPYAPGAMPRAGLVWSRSGVLRRRR
jgi:hypothetical protein